MSHVIDELNSTLAGRYSVERELGKGGMAVVYLAMDLRHQRRVALKVLRDDVSVSTVHARFAREIEIAASLNHPNILPIHDSGRAGERLYYVMPLVEGESLRARMDREQFIEVTEAIRLVSEVADGLAHAHERGVIHRDIKPENILLVAGHAVLADFGIARAIGGDRENITTTGVTVGTPLYMSPEQAMGSRVDARSDIYSLGCVAYEMLAGEPPFTGPTPQAVLARHTVDPVRPIRSVRPSVPEGVESAIEKALAKVPSDRFSDAREFASSLASPWTARRSGWSMRRRQPTAALAAVAAVLAAAAAAAALRAPDGGKTPTQLVNVSRLTWEDGAESWPELSPDGRWLVYSHRGALQLRSVGATSSIVLTSPANGSDGHPSFSPDGKLLAFSSTREGSDVAGGIWLVEATGGAPRRLSRHGFVPVWSADGKTIYFIAENVTDFIGWANSSQLWAVSVSGGEPWRISSGDFLMPSVSPSGEHVAFSRGAFDRGLGGLRSIWTMRLDGRDSVNVVSGDSLALFPRWSGDGRFIYYVLFSGVGSLWRIPIDESTGAARGPPEHVPVPAADVRRFALGPDGLIVYEAADTESNVWRVSFDPVRGDVTGEPAPVTTGTRRWEDLDISRDGRLLLSLGLSKLHIADSLGKVMAEVPNGRADRFARWSPDGRRIAFSSMRTGGFETWIADGSGENATRYTHFGNGGAGFFPQWSPDGQRLAIITAAQFGGTTYLFDASRSFQEQKPDTLPAPPGDRSLRYRPWSWSPDGRRLLTYSLRGAGLAAYDFTTSRWETLTRSGQFPRWLSDSRRIVYSDSGRIFLRTAHGEIRQLMAGRGAVLSNPVPSPGDRFIYFVRSHARGDIWQATVRESR